LNRFHGNGPIDFIDILDDKIISLIDLLEKRDYKLLRVERSNARKNNKKY
jgi:hypothetical protein